MKKNILFLIFISFATMLSAQNILSLDQIKEFLIMGDDQVEWRVYKEKTEQENADGSFVAVETYYHEDFVAAMMFTYDTFNYLWIDEDGIIQNETKWSPSEDYKINTFNPKYGSETASWELISIDSSSLVIRNYEDRGEYKIALLTYLVKGMRLTEEEAMQKNEAGPFSINGFTKTMYERSINK